jgi:hypothetical protein
MSSQGFLAIFQTLLILLIAVATSYMAYQLYRTSSSRQKNELNKKRLKIYREIVRLLSVISRDGDISRDELLAFRSKTHESGFLFGKDVAEYVEEIYSRSLKLRSSNALLKEQNLPVGEERDKVTVENSKQMIWLADQLPRLKQTFERYLTNHDAKVKDE